MARFDRRDVLIGGGVVAAGTVAPAMAAGAKTTRRAAAVTEATNVALTVAPNGSTIAFDLLGILWLVPATGGEARRLTDDYGDLAQPDWSPDGHLIAFQSYRGGNFGVWTIAPDGSGLKQWTTGPFDAREPRFTPDGRAIAFSSDRSGRYALHRLDLASGAVSPLSDPSGTAQHSEPAPGRDGRLAYVANATRLILRDASGAEREVASVPKGAPIPFLPSEIRAPAFAPDGTLVWTEVREGRTTLRGERGALVESEDLFPFRPAWFPNGDLLYAGEGRIWRRPSGGAPRAIAFRASVSVATPHYAKGARDHHSTAPQPVKGIGAPALSPDGRQVAFRTLNDIWLLPIGGTPRRLIADDCHKLDPAWSPDGRTLAYASDREGTLDLWLRDLAAGTDRRLTALPHAAVSPAWSRDGALIAFLDQAGALYTVEVATGAVRRELTATWEPGKPSFGPLGHIALAAFKPYSARYREGLSEVLMLDRATGATTYTPVQPHRSIATRGDDGPVWSPDGRWLAYVFASTLWVQPVRPDGVFDGAARQLTTEVTDAPTWSGDSQNLLYLSNGRLRLIGIGGGAPRPVRLDLTWARAKPADTKIVRAGRLWDGTGRDSRRDVDITITGDWIARITPASGPLPPGALDATARTVLPGLIDIHTHRQMQGYGFGDRQGRLWLAYGITSTRSPGAPAYHMVEDREAVDGGHRIGPRHFATGEAIDGGRIYYNFMRPVTEPGQLALEISRARALGYDLVKTYVRLPHEVQAEVARSAHAAGQHVTSHYHYPALANGVDQVEHLGATSRFGYSRTLTAQGAGYGDVIGLFAAARAARTPTLFAANALLRDDRSLVEDSRTRALYPPWEYAALLKRVELLRSPGFAALTQVLERNVAQIRATLDQGWRVISGTDAPIDATAISLHLQLRGMVRFGIAPWEALLTATRWSGEFLDQPIGTVTPGALADLIVVHGDPLTDIAAAANVTHVLNGGDLHTPAALIGRFAATPAPVALNTVLPSLPHAHPQPFWHEAAYVEGGRTACCAGHSLPA